jgi:hypothetical protein
MYIRVKEGETCRKLDILGANWGNFQQIIEAKFSGFEFETKLLSCKPPIEFTRILGTEFILDNEIKFNSLKTLLNDTKDIKSALFTFQAISVDKRMDDCTEYYKEGGRGFDSRTKHLLKTGGGGDSNLSKTILVGKFTKNTLDPDRSHLDSLIYSQTLSDSGSESPLDPRVELAKCSPGKGHPSSVELMSSIFTVNELAKESSFTISQEEQELNKELLDTITTAQEETHLWQQVGVESNQRGNQGNYMKRSKAKAGRLQQLDSRQLEDLFPALTAAQAAKRTSMVRKQQI